MVIADRRRHCRFWAVPALCLAALPTAAQPTPPVDALRPIPRFPVRADPLAVTAAVQPANPFTVAGPFGAIFGEQNVPVGNARVDIQLTREGGGLLARARSAVPVVLCLVGGAAPRDLECPSAAALEHTLELPLPAVEVALPHGLPPPGSETGQLQVISRHMSSNRLDLELAARAGTSYDLPLRLNRPGVRASGAELAENVLHARFPAGNAYQRLSVSFSW